MKNLIYIFNYQFLASILGWILQQSKTVDSNFCLYDVTNDDPWDNHWPNVENEEDGIFLHKFIVIQEDANRNINELTTHVKNFTKYNTGVLGNSYGIWEHKIPWNCDGVTKIYTYIEDVDLITDLWLNVYFKRKFDEKHMRASIYSHCHDHHFENKEYQDEMVTRHLSRAEELLKEQEVIEFWQLQAVYHSSWKEIPSLDRYNEYREEVRNGILRSQYNNNFVNYNNCISLEMMNINLEEVCDTLNIKFNSRMQSEYEIFKLFVENHT